MEERAGKITSIVRKFHYHGSIGELTPCIKVNKITQITGERKRKNRKRRKEE